MQERALLSACVPGAREGANLVLIGETGNDRKGTCGTHPATPWTCNKLSNSVSVCASGYIVLAGPACASFDIFRASSNDENFNSDVQVKAMSKVRSANVGRWT